MVHIFTSQPIDREHSRGFIRTARNYAHDQDPQVMIDFNDVIFGQDKFIVETQRPEHVPFDLADELHLDFDKVAVNYRKTMRETGLAMKNPDGSRIRSRPDGNDPRPVTGRGNGATAGSERWTPA